MHFIHWILYNARWYIGLLVLLLLGVTVMKYSAWIDHKIFGRARQPKNVSQQLAQPGGPHSIPAASSAAGAPATSAYPPADVVTQLSHAKLLLDKSSANASEALEAVLTWKTDVEPMRDEVLVERTGAVAGSERGEVDGLFDRLAHVMGRERMSAEQLRAAATRIDSLQTKVDDLLKQSRPAALSLIDMADISELHVRCEQAKEDWQEDTEWALVLKDQIDKGTGTPAVPTTIGDKIEDADFKQKVKRLDERIERERKEEADSGEREAERAKQRREQEERESELLTQATSPEVKSLLAPFFEPRTIQPSLSGTFSIRWMRTSEKKPMSLSRLTSIGVLDESELGLKKLALVIGNRKLPEPKWSIASQPNNWSTDDEERLKRAQQTLRDYGPILVKAGLLSE